MRIKVYVASPISKGDRMTNVKTAIDVGIALIKEGFAPLVPALSHYIEAGGGTFPHATWLDVDDPWVLSADALLRLPGESAGADHEVELAKKHGIPVYYSINDLVLDPPALGDERFLLALLELAILHKKKAKDYGSDKDPLSNIRSSEEFGIPAWLGAILRGSDKVQRLKTFAVKKKLANEGVEDSLIDLSAYALIGLVLYRESLVK